MSGFLLFTHACPPLPLEAQNIYDLQTVNEQQFDKFWSWIGPSLKKIRYQQQVIWLFKSGYFPAFVTRVEAEKELQKYDSGAFLIRLGREPGAFIISYNSGEPGEVHHYIMQQDDTADKKKDNHRFHYERISI